MLSPPPVLTEPVDVLVAAGDIHAGDRAPAWLRAQYGNLAKNIIYVPGNHEYYQRIMPAVDERIQQACLNNDVYLLKPWKSVVIDGVYFCGGTLWTDFKLDGDPNPAMAYAAAHMNDFRLIRENEDGDILTPHDTTVMHGEHKAAITAQMCVASEVRKTVVVTHHGPSRRSVHPRYAGDMLNAAFNSDLGLESGWGPDLWIHGHVHDEFDYTAGRTRVVVNPRGYPNEVDRLEPYALKIITV